jgi:hypothetical protein
MVKEPKNVDFYTTGRQPSEQDFARISDWIRKNKQKPASRELKVKKYVAKRLDKQVIL